MNIHPITLATIRRHLSDAALKVAQLESKQRRLPALRSTSNQALRLAREVKEARAEYASWVSVEREASAS